jgi:3-dehydroquinate dehydratase/shikimate dehydrogenase
MRHVGDEIVKVVYSVKSTSDVLQIFQASKACSENAGQDKIVICMGHYGIYSRLLAEKFGSFLTYSSALAENEVPGAPGQIDVRELAELYRFRKITKKTKVYGVAGYPLKASVSPWFFNTVFGLQNIDAVYVPFPANSIADFLEIAKELDVQGLSITVPYKEAVIPYLARSSAAVQSIGACNTLYHNGNEWFGDNTDCAGFSESLLEFLDRKNLRFKKITIIGAGGVARSVAAEIHRYGGKALVLNRTVHKAKNIASQYNFRWGGLDSQGIGIMAKYCDIIIQTSSVGMEGGEDSTLDPLELYTFSGKEKVMDLVYTPAVTPFLERAADAGCETINGYDMVIRQACLQYAIYMGAEVPRPHLSRINSMGASAWNKKQSS